ncbi:MAG: alpha/beta hydrolase [Gemmatimonadota bacterium]
MLASLLCCGNQPKPAVAARHPDAPLPAVGMVFRRYVDTTRRNWDEDGWRPLTTAIWYPTSTNGTPDTIWIGAPNRHEFMSGTALMGAPLDSGPTRHPLIVLSHGTGGSALQLMWLGQQLAAHGFIVAAVNHHGNTGAEPKATPQGFVLWWERARDMSAVISAVLADSAFRNRIDTTRIGAAGFSLGGYTMIELAGGRTDLGAFAEQCRSKPNPTLCDAPPEYPKLLADLAALGRNQRFVTSLARSGDSYRDRRIKAVFAIAPAQGGAFTAAGLSDIHIPVSIVVGDSDLIAPAASNAAYFAARIAGATLQTIPLAGHYTFLSPCTANGVEDIPLLCHDPAGANRISIHRQVADSAAAFFDRHW